MKICAAEPWCCQPGGGWSPSCVQKVALVCGAVCPPPGCGANCPVPGACEPWDPGATDPSCPGIDLTAGIPCSSGGATVLPVCNHGLSTAPAGIPIAVYPANSGKIPSLDPGAPNASSCWTTEPVPPGQCIDVATCGSLSGNKEIRINPPGVSGGVAECRSDNDWTLAPANPSACEAPSCGGAPCEPVYAPLSVEEVYEAVCPANRTPRWGFFAYDTATPQGSWVELRVAASATTSFAGATDHLAAVAETSSGTSLCAMGGPSPCPVRLFDLLGFPAEEGLYLRLRATLWPSSDGSAAPTLFQWNITYSCLDSE